jgi:nicotinamidase-related amidase
MSNQSSKQYEMKGQYTPENSALVLIDHQVGTLTFVHNMSSDESLRNAIMLAKAAKAYGMPIVLTTSQEDHAQGRLRPHCSRRCRRFTRIESSVPGLLTHGLIRISVLQSVLQGARSSLCLQSQRTSA